jgi:hypothetical protein
VGNPGAVPEWMNEPITITLKNIVWSPAPSEVLSISGGVDFNGDGNPDTYAQQNGSTTPQPVAAPTDMWWSSATNGVDTIIRLYNSPLKAPCVDNANPCGAGGLTANVRLYALEYIPSPVEDLPDSLSPAPFTTNLTTAGQGAKNTARWAITIPSLSLPTDRMITVETRIGNDLAADYPNVSRTSGAARTYGSKRTNDPGMSPSAFSSSATRVTVSPISNPRRVGPAAILELGYNRCAIPRAGQRVGSMAGLVTTGSP